MLQGSYVQVHSLVCYRAREFSWNQGTLINNHIQNKKEKLTVKNLHFYLLETLGNCILNDKFKP